MTTKKLHKFEGREVVGTRIAITRAGDGLSKALAIEPEELQLGQTVYVVLECTVTRIAHEKVADTDSLTRVQTLQAGAATTVDKELVAGVLDEQKRRIEAAQGIERLDFDEDGDADGNGSE